MKNIKLGPKLIGGFCLTALIALIIGLISINGMRNLTRGMESIGSVSLPTVEHLLRMKSSISDLTTGLRTLLSTNLSPNDRKEIAANIAAIRATYRKPWIFTPPCPRPPRRRPSGKIARKPLPVWPAPTTACWN